MQKEIHFYYDLPLYDDDPLYQHYICTTYEGTKRCINWGMYMIRTTSLANLSFDLLDKGYKIFLHQNNKVLEAKPGMEGTVRDVRREHNIMKMWIAGAFNDYFAKKNHNQGEILKIPLE